MKRFILIGDILRMEIKLYIDILSLEFDIYLYLKIFPSCKQLPITGLSRGR